MAGEAYRKQGEMEKNIPKEVPLPDVEKKGITRRQFLGYAAGGTVAALTIEEIAIGAIRNALFAKTEVAPYTGEVPSTLTPADYAEIDGNGNVNLRKLAASTEKLGFKPVYRIFPKSKANDEVIESGLLAGAQLYAGLISDGKRVKILEFFNLAFLDKVNNKWEYSFMNEQATKIDNIALVSEEFEVDGYKRYMKYTEGIFCIDGFVPLEEIVDIFFASPDKSLGIELQKIA